MLGAYGVGAMRRRFWKRSKGPGRRPGLRGPCCRSDAFGGQLAGQTPSVSNRSDPVVPLQGTAAKARLRSFEEGWRERARATRTRPHIALMIRPGREAGTVASPGPVAVESKDDTALCVGGVVGEAPEHVRDAVYGQPLPMSSQS
jgi:hypothetical protein